MFASELVKKLEEQISMDGDAEIYVEAEFGDTINTVRSSTATDDVDGTRNVIVIES